MDFLPPDLPTVGSTRCPMCRQKIGMHRVKPQTVCPHCKAALRSNIASAFNRAVAWFAGLVMAWLAVRWLTGADLFGVATSIAAVAAFYVAHGLYRWMLRVEPNGAPHAIHRVPD